MASTRTRSRTEPRYCLQKPRRGGNCSETDILNQSIFLRFEHDGRGAGGGACENWVDAYGWKEVILNVAGLSRFSTRLSALLICSGSLCYVFDMILKFKFLVEWYLVLLNRLCGVWNRWMLIAKMLMYLKIINIIILWHMSIFEELWIGNFDDFSIFDKLNI